MHHAPFHHKQHERTHVCSTTLKVSRTAEAARTTRSTEAATAEAALILLLPLLLAGALGKHGLEYLDRLERLLEFGIIPLLNLQTESGKTKCARFEKRNVQKSGKTKRSKNFAHTTL